MAHGWNSLNVIINVGTILSVTCTQSTQISTYTNQLVCSLRHLATTHNIIIIKKNLGTKDNCDLYIDLAPIQVDIKVVFPVVLLIWYSSHLVSKAGC